MAKRKSSGGACTRQTISFKTARGRRVSFNGRPGGTTNYGGDCAPRAITSAQRLQRARFRAAAQQCRQDNRKTRNTCVRNVLRGTPYGRRRR